MPELRAPLAALDVPPHGDEPMELPSEVPGADERLVSSAREVMTIASRLRGDIVGEDFMAVALMTGAVSMGSNVVRNPV